MLDYSPTISSAFVQRRSETVLNKLIAYWHLHICSRLYICLGTSYTDFSLVQV